MRVLLLILLVLPSAWGEIRHVPEDYGTIQEALDATDPADTVWVSPGTYHEHLLGPTHGFTLMSNYPFSGDSLDIYNTILDGSETGTCLKLRSTNYSWARLQGLTVQNGYGTDLPGGLFCNDSTRVEISHVRILNHQSTGPPYDNAEASCIRIRVPVIEAVLKDVVIRNQSGDIRSDITVDVVEKLQVDGLVFAGSDSTWYGSRLLSIDSLFVSDLSVQNFQRVSQSLRLAGYQYVRLDDVAVSNCNADGEPMIAVGGGVAELNRFSLTDCNHVDNGQHTNATIALISVDHLKADSLVIQSNTVLEDDIIEFRVSEEGAQNSPGSSIRRLHLIGNAAGPNPTNLDSPSPRIASIQRCSLYDSFIIGNRVQLPDFSEQGLGVSLRRGAGMYIHHDVQDSLVLSNVEFSNNEILDPDDHYSLIQSHGADQVLGSLGGALYLSLHHTGSTIIRDCVFDHNRIENVVPETDFYWSMGATVYIWQGYPGGVDNTIIENCTFTRNDEGGLMVAGEGNITIRQCTLKNNFRYGLTLTGHRFDMQNVMIDGVIAHDFLLQGFPSRQCAISLAQLDAVPSIFRNVTISGCDVRNLFSGTFPAVAETQFQSFLVTGNTYDHLQTHWNNPEYDQAIRFDYSVLPEVPQVGADNIITEENQFHLELGAPWLSESSICIDNGSADVAWNDPEDPDNPGFARWPSQGDLRNDIGYTGGPYAGTLDHIVRVAPRPEDRGLLPARLQLLPNYPNPFNSQTRLEYDLPTTGPVSIRLYDIQGRMVKELFQGSQAVGRHQMLLRGDGLASGVYFVRVEAGGESEVRKVLLLK